MSKRSDKLLIQDILFCIEKIKRYTLGYDFDTYLNDDLIKDAVVRNLEIIGEASNRVSNKIKN